MQKDCQSKRYLGKSFKALRGCKSSSRCVFLGSGSSINRVTPEQWKRLLCFDKWTVNNWVYHPFIVPDFYHVEVKYYNYRLIQRRLFDKQDAYRDTHFIFQNGKTIKVDGQRLPLHEVAFEGADKYRYYVQSRDPHRTHKKFNADYAPDKIITKSYDMSLTSVFEMMWRVGYKEVILCGVDLNNSLYFWTGGDPIYGEVHHQTNKAHENRPPESPHATHRITDFIVDFNRRWMKPHGRNMYVINEDSALYPEIPLYES